MRIAMVPPLWEAVPPTGYGAIETIAADLCRNLESRGHEVTLFAAGDSTATTRLISACSRPLGEGWAPEPEVYRFLQMLQVREHVNHFDVVHVHLHSHTGMLGAAALADLQTPLVFTVHCVLSPPVVRLLQAAKPDALVGVSEYQMGPLTNSDLHPYVIPNAVDFREFALPTRSASGGYLISLGRVRDLKGTHLAIDIAQRASMPLKIAGRIKAEDTDYFATLIAPRLNQQVVYVGEIAQRTRGEILREATALLFTSQRDDPFGLVMIEAMANGTPVIALENCAAGEVVDDGVTGFLARDIDHAVECLSYVTELDRARVRARAMERFSIDLMADRYERLYEVVASSDRVA